MNKLELIKTDHFGDIETDIYSNGNDIFMTIDQLSQCLGYAGRDGIEKIMERNAYLLEKEFSTTDKLSAVEGTRQVTRERRIFTEDGKVETLKFEYHTEKEHTKTSPLKSGRKWKLCLKSKQ